MILSKKIFQSIFIAIIASSSFSMLIAQSQGIGDLLERYTGANANGYVEPLITAFGADLNSGWFYTANIPKSGFHLDLRLNAMSARFSDDQRNFTATTAGFFLPEQEVETATIVGNTQGTIVDGVNGTTFPFPGGYDLNSFSLVVPTITIGSLYGTEISGRYFSYTSEEVIGGFKLVGLAIRHSLSQYIPKSGIDIAFGAGFNKFNVKALEVNDEVSSDLISTTTWNVHAEVGKSFSVLDLYSGFALENSQADVQYQFTFEDQSENVDLNITGKNKFRYLIGFALNLSILHLHFDYNLGNQNLLNAGLSLGF